MRKIKFRGKRLDNGEWVYGDLLQYRVLPVILDENLKQHEVYGETVGQYTGLRDKNGIEIYEGDIVSGDVVKLVSGIYEPCAYIKQEFMEIMGNIHDE